MIKKIGIISSIFFCLALLGLVSAVEGQFMVEELFQSATDACGNDYQSMGTFVDNDTQEIRHCMRTSSFNPGDSYLKRSYLHQTTADATQCPTGTQEGLFKGVDGDVLLCVETKVPVNGDYLSTDTLINETCPTDSGWINTSTESIQLTDGEFVRHCRKIVEITDINSGICGNFTGIITDIGDTCKYDIEEVADAGEDAGTVKTGRYQAGDASCPDTLSCTCTNDGSYAANEGWSCVDLSGECDLDNLRWVSKEGDTLGNGESVYGWHPGEAPPPGEEVLLVADSSGGCVGEDINFAIFESDVFIDDFFGSITSKATANGLRWEATWKPPLTVDGLFGLGSEPEFYFREEINGKIRNSVSQKIKVVEPECTSDHLGGCVQEGECKDAGGSWVNGACVVDGTECGPGSLSGCNGENACEIDGGGQWDGSNCLECTENDHCTGSDEMCVNNECSTDSAGGCGLNNARWILGSSDPATEVESGNSIGLKVELDSGICDNVVFEINGRNAPPNIGAQDSGGGEFTYVWIPSISESDAEIFGNPQYSFTAKVAGSDVPLATSGLLTVTLPECSASNLDLCDSSSDCEDADGEWDGNSCESEGDCELSNPKWLASNGDEVSGDVNDEDSLYLVVEGTSQCEGESVVFEVTYDSPLPGGDELKHDWTVAVAEDGASKSWDALFVDVGGDFDSSDYHFEAYIEGKVDIRSGQSDTLTVLGEPSKSGGCTRNGDDAVGAIVALALLCGFSPSSCGTM